MKMKEEQKLRKRWIAMLLAAAMAVGTLAGCGASGGAADTETESAAAADQGNAAAGAETEAAGAANDAAAEGTRTVVDATGSEVVIPAEIESFIVTAGPYATVAWQLEGCNSERLIGQMVNMVSPMNQAFFDRFDPNYASSCIEAIGPNGAGVNVEELVAMGPDVVFLWNTQTAEAEQLQAAGVPAVMLDVAGMTGDDLYDQAAIIAEVLGDQDRYEAMRADYDARIAYLEEHTADVPE